MPKVEQSVIERSKSKVFLTLRRYPAGLSEADLEQLTGIGRRTVNNYLRQLELEGKVYKEGITWLALPYDQVQLRKFDLAPEEAMTLYLATRLLVKQQDKRNEPAESALMKLAEVLTADAGVGHEIHQAALDLAHRPSAGGHDQVFRRVMQGYIFRRVLRLTYAPARGRPFETDLSPYLIEPSAIGYATYVIGHSSVVNALRTYKLERIQAAALTRQEYRIPPDFPGLELLRSAWSIVTGDETVRVVLRFSPRVMKRVLETRWHPSQATGDDPDKPGWLRWQVDVADTLDLLPWVRGWGADLEVLEPEELRQSLKREAQELAQLYQVPFAPNAKTTFYAHSRADVDKSEWQPLLDHLANTAQLAAALGRDAGVSELARVAAWMHDLGKYSHAFQRRLEGAKQRVDHSTAGAQELVRLFTSAPLPQKLLAELLTYCIAGHHTGLPDGGSPIDVGETGTLYARLKTKLEDYSAYQTEVDTAQLSLPPRLTIRPITGYQGRPLMGFSAAFLTRMVYSALVDADFQDTENYYQNGVQGRGGHASVEALRQQFNQYLEKFDQPQSDLNRQRTKTLRACLDQAANKPGFFTLTIPTGGGKTLSSMAFALNHAVQHGLQRIIYVIPFTSIIEQNAAVFKDCLGDASVLEHHSNFDWDPKRQGGGETADDQTNSALAKLKLAAENWDIPVVATTNVQFFESLFANRSARCRKVHNLAKSVIIFDEAQMLPREYLYPAMYAVWELVVNYGASAVFCTATQPAVQTFLPAGTPVTELAPDPQGLFDFYQRVRVISLDTVADADLLAQINRHAQALCIVNTRRHAKGLFAGLSEDGRFHLSTLMCPAHRQATLLEIRARLKAGQTCRVVSTQVMEAGIDVDFPVGYRALAGLDSIIQAAGRVNREAQLPTGELYVFEPASEFVKRTPAYIEQGAAVARSILREFSANPVSMAAINAYFERLYSLQAGQQAFDAKDILGCFKAEDGLDFKFKTAAERFRLIENDLVAVIIPYNAEAQQLIEELKYTPYPATTLRKLQRYTVNIYETEFQALSGHGAIATVADKYAVLNNLEADYDETGLVIPADSGGAVFY